MPPELIGILAVGATLIGVGATIIGLLRALWRDARADTQALRAEVRGDLADLRKDVQGLTERLSRPKASSKAFSPVATSPTPPPDRLHPICARCPELVLS